MLGGCVSALLDVRLGSGRQDALGGSARSLSLGLHVPLATNQADWLRPLDEYANTFATDKQEIVPEGQTVGASANNAPRRTLSGDIRCHSE